MCGFCLTARYAKVIPKLMATLFQTEKIYAQAILALFKHIVVLVEVSDAVLSIPS
jgi:hypothetical protein